MVKINFIVLLGRGKHIWLHSRLYQQLLQISPPCCRPPSCHPPLYPKKNLFYGDQRAATGGRRQENAILSLDNLVWIQPIIYKTSLYAAAVQVFKLNLFRSMPYLATTFYTFCYKIQLKECSSSTFDFRQMNVNSRTEQKALEEPFNCNKAFLTERREYRQFISGVHGMLLLVFT